MGSSNFGTGITRGTTTSSGVDWGLDGDDYVFLPQAYASGNSLAATMSFANATFQSLGVPKGTYTWSLSSNGNDTITLNVVPIPAALPLMAGALAAFGFLYRRRHKATTAA